MRREITKALDISEVRSKAAIKSNAANAPAKDPASATQLQSQLHNKNKSREKPRKKRATQLTKKWLLPDDYRAYCKTKRPELNPDLVAENFLDYYLSHGKPMADWKRTWQRWVRNERPPQGNSYQKPDVHSSTHEPVDFEKLRDADKSLDPVNPYADMKP